MLLCVLVTATGPPLQRRYRTSPWPPNLPGAAHLPGPPRTDHHRGQKLGTRPPLREGRTLGTHLGLLSGSALRMCPFFKNHKAKNSLLPSLNKREIDTNYVKTQDSSSSWNWAGGRSPGTPWWARPIRLRPALTLYTCRQFLPWSLSRFQIMLMISEKATTL